MPSSTKFLPIAKGAQGSTNVSWVAPSGKSFPARVTGQTLVNEVQTVTVTAAITGTYTLTIPGYGTTAAIAFDATAGAVQSAIRAVHADLAGVTVTGGPSNTSALVVTFAGGTTSGKNIAQMTSTNSTTGGSIAHATTTQGSGFNTFSLYVPGLPHASRVKTGVAKRTAMTQVNVWYSYL